MSPLEVQILIDAIRKINKRFDESDARFDEFDAQIEGCFSRSLAAPEQFGDAVELRDGGSEQFGVTQLVVADNRGGLFDGDDSIEQQFQAPIVADNWGGEFDELAHITEERSYELAGSDAGSPPPVKEQFALDSTSIGEIEPEEYPHHIWGGLFKHPAHDPEEHDLGLSVIDSAQIRHEHVLNSIVPVVHEPAPVLVAASAIPEAPFDAGTKLVWCGPIDIESISAPNTASFHSAPDATTIEYTSTAVPEEYLLQIQEREEGRKEPEVVEIDEKVLSTGSKVLKDVVSALDRNSATRSAFSAPHLPRRALLRPPRFTRPSCAHPLRRPWRLPPRPPRPWRRRPRRAPPRPHWLRRTWHAPPRLRRLLIRGQRPRLRTRTRPRTRPIRRRRRRLRLQPLPRLRPRLRQWRAALRRFCSDAVGAAGGGLFERHARTPARIDSVLSGAVKVSDGTWPGALTALVAPSAYILAVTLLQPSAADVIGHTVFVCSGTKPNYFVAPGCARLRTRARRTTSTWRRSPLRRLVWRPPWCVAACSGRSRRRGTGRTLRVSGCLRTTSMLGRRTGLHLHPPRWMHHRGVPAPTLPPPPPRDATTTSSLVLAAAWTMSGAHSIHAARMFDEMSLCLQPLFARVPAPVFTSQCAALPSVVVLHVHTAVPDAALSSVGGQGLVISHDTLVSQAKELLRCEGDFTNSCGFNLIGAPVVLVRSCAENMVNLRLLSLSDWVEQHPLPPPNQMVSQFGKPVPVDCNQYLHQLIQQPPLCCKSTAHLFMLLLSQDEVHCSAYLQHFCQELIHLGSYTREHETVLPILSQGIGFKFRMLSEDESHVVVLLVFANSQDLTNAMTAIEINGLGLDGQVFAVSAHAHTWEIINKAKFWIIYGGSGWVYPRSICCSMSWVINWKPPWFYQLTHFCQDLGYLGLPIVAFQDVAEHVQPRYFTANLAHAYSVDGAVVRLCSATNASHAVMMALEGTSAQNLMMLEPLLVMEMSRHAHLYTARCFEFQPWQPLSQVQVLTDQGFNRVVFGNLSEPRGLMPKPPWPPPKSNLTWFQLSVSFVLSCPLHQPTLPSFNCVCCQECWKLWLEFLPCAVQVAELNNFKFNYSWERLHMFQMFPGQLLGVDKWGLILTPHQGVFLVDSVHVMVVVTISSGQCTCSYALLDSLMGHYRDAAGNNVAELSMHMLVDGNLVEASATTALGCSLHTKSVSIQMPWDPGDLYLHLQTIVHWLEGKPILKEEGMSGVAALWAQEG